MVWDVVNEPLIGMMQDREYLGRFFAKETYGRRAPWFIVHLPILAACSFAILAPAVQTTPGIYAWFFCVMFLSKWCYTECATSYSSATVEIYPLKEERMQNEMLNIPFVWLGAIVGLVSYSQVVSTSNNEPEFSPYSGEPCPDYKLGTCTIGAAAVDAHKTEADCLAADGTWKPTGSNLNNGYVFGAVCFLLSMVSLFAVSPMKDARQACEAAKNKEESLWQFAKTVMPRREVWTLFGLQFLDKVYTGTQASFVSLFLTYVTGENRKDMGTHTLLIPAAGMVTQIIMACVCGWFFSKHDDYEAAGAGAGAGGGDGGRNKNKFGHNPQMFACVGKLISAVVAVAIFTSTTHWTGLLIYYVTDRVLFAPKTFFFVAARAWVIDEDAQRCHGRRREALFVSLLHISGNAAAIVVSIMITAVAWAGIKTDECTGFPQPAAGVSFLRYGVFIAAIPLTHLLNAVLIAKFPIKGERIAALEANQAALWQKGGGGGGGGKPPSSGAVVAPSGEGDAASSEEEGGGNSRAAAAAAGAEDGTMEIQVT